MIKLFLMVLIALFIPVRAYSDTYAISPPFQLDTKNPDVLSYNPGNGTETGNRTPISAVISNDIDQATVVLTVSGSSSESVSGTKTWQESMLTFSSAGAYKAGETVTVTLSGTDGFGNPLPETPWSFTIGEHNPWLTIKAAAISDAATMTCKIDYTVGDPDNSYKTTRGWQYSLDGTKWVDILQASLSPEIKLQAPGNYSLYWKLPDALKGLYTTSLLFRMEADDGSFQSGYQVSPPIAVDWNTPPAVAITKVNVSYGDYKTFIHYTITDPESDAASLSFEYSLDGGTSWVAGKADRSLSGFTSDRYSGYFGWLFSDGLADGTDYPAVQVRLAASDHKAGSPALSDPFPVDLNEPPSVTLDDIYAPQSRDVTIRYHIADAEGDTIRFDCYYSLDAGGAWKKTANVTGADGILSYDGSLVWHSKRDENVVESMQTRFRLVPRDHDEGTGDQTINFTLVNTYNEAPTATLSISDPDSVWSNTVPVSFVLTDAEKDTLSLEAAYSIDKGVTFAPATVQGAVSGITAGSYSETLRWDSKADIPAYYGEVVFRLTPRDKDPGASNSITLVVDNFGVCRVALSAPTGEQTSDVTVSYTITDPNSRAVTLSVDYSRDDGRTWSQAATTGSISGIGRGQYTGSFVWTGKTNLKGFDGTVKLRVTPNNGMDGLPDIETVTVDYNEPPLLSANPLSGEHTGSIALICTTTDAEKDAVTVKFEYSTDGGKSYTAGSMSGTTWNSVNDIGFCYQRETYLRMTPSDKDAGAPVVLGPFTVTNLVGDYTADLAIDGQYLLRFSDVWKTTDRSVEIGPVTGTPPNLMVTPDGIVDFEDLTVFAWMWQWYTERGSEKHSPGVEMARPAVDESQLWDGIRIVPETSGVVLFVGDQPLDFLNLYISVGGNSKGIVVSGSDYWTSAGNGIVLTRTYQDGLIELAAAYLGSGQTAVTRSITYALLQIPNGETIEGIDISYKARIHGEEAILTGTATISKGELNVKPATFSLFQNTPNPFNPLTTIEYTLPQESRVRFVVYNVSGQQVTVIKNTVEGSGRYSVTWNAADMPSGLYFYRLETNGFVGTKKMLLVK